MIVLICIFVCSGIYLGAYFWQTKRNEDKVNDLKKLIDYDSNVSENHDNGDISDASGTDAVNNIEYVTIDGECVFDGKIGCFPLVTYERAIRDSGNRLRGALVVKPIQSITRDVIRDFMVNKVLPAIRAKWPREDVDKPIFIQQDNAPSHLKVDDPQFCEVAKQDGFDIRLICQPPNSPDFNILDLGFFRAIQAIQYKKNAKTKEDLIPIVQQVHSSYVLLLHFIVNN